MDLSDDFYFIFLGGAKFISDEAVAFYNHGPEDETSEALALWRRILRALLHIRTHDDIHGTVAASNRPDHDGGPFGARATGEVPVMLSAWSTSQRMMNATKLSPSSLRETSTHIGVEPRRMAFVLLPEFTMLSMVSAIEILRVTNVISGQLLYEWTLHTLAGKTVSASNGQTIATTKALDLVPKKATITVCAGLRPAQYTSKVLISWLRKRAALGSEIGSLCTGAYILAEAGLLDGYNCTVHWEYMPSFKEMFPEVVVNDNIYEIDRKRFSSAGIGTVDLVLRLVASHHGEELANAVARSILHLNGRNALQRQRAPLSSRLGVRHRGLLEILDHMEKNLDEPLERVVLSRRAGLSLRQVERLFIRYVGVTPRAHYRALRLRKAQCLLSETTMSVVDVSDACGFASASHFAKVYRKFFGHVPSSKRLSTVADSVDSPLDPKHCS